ncbi:MAG: PfkB family carbohydrate kinase [Eubacteriales bacterium]|nr:PfkB family carbohydrate kinase [Eubacteriales bacterium]
MGNAVKALVIGGMNVDILGVPAGNYRPGDSMPGVIRLSVGGVGFNIASNLARSGIAVTFITVIGNDHFARIAQDACQSLSLDMGLACRVADPSPTYMAVHHQDGAMAAAINDMASMAALKPSYLQAHKNALSEFYDVCVIDANLPPDTIGVIPKYARASILADPVSVEKGRRLLPVLPRLAAIKPNAMEALALSGCKDIPDAAGWFLRQGVKQIFISLGEDGLYFASSEGSGCLPPKQVIKTPSTGAGDAMASGLAHGIASGKSAEDTAKLGLAAAAKFLNSK